MLNQIRCNKCDGTELIKEDGMFVCQHCHAKYSVEEIRKMVLGDGGVLATSQQFNDEFHILAREAFRKKDFDEALHYYKMIQEKQPDDWQAVYWTTYLKHFCGYVPQDDLLEKFNLLRNALDKSKRLFEKTQEFKEKKQDQMYIFKGILNNTLGICNKYRLVSNYHIFNNVLNIFNKYRFIEKYRELINHSISQVYDLVGDSYYICLNEKENALFCWKNAFMFTKIMQERNKLQDKYEKASPEAEIESDCSSGYLLYFLLLLLFLLILYSIIF